MLKTLWRYLQVSCLSFVTNFGLTMVLHELCGLPEEWAFAIALTVVFALNFVAMRLYIYNARHGSLWRQGLTYVGSAMAFRAAEYLAFLIGHTWLGGDYRVIILTITVVSAGSKFFYYRGLFERSRPERRQYAQSLTG